MHSARTAGCTAAADGVSARAWRDTIDTARRLESLPHVAAAAHAGTVSNEQLTPLAQLADPIVEQLRAQARIEPVLVDELRVPVARGRTFPALSPKITRAVLTRDGHCRYGTRDRRHGLQIHHLWPRSWGDTDRISDLAAVCTGGGTDHHPMLVPHGPWLLVGNPNRPDGLRLVHRDHVRGGLDQYIRARRSPTLEELGLHDPDIRAGPDPA